MPPNHPASKTIRPPLEAFRRAGWLPVNQAAYDDWMKGLSSRIQRHSRGAQPELLQPVQDLKTFIETNAMVYQEFLRMFDGVTESPTNLDELMSLYNDIFRRAPEFGSLGPPMYMIMARMMNTQAGFSAFTKDNLNQHYKKMLQTWELFLLSKDSREVLNKSETGWLGDKALSGMMAGYAADRTFDQVFVCDPNADYYGYVSWEDFFARPYKNPGIDRPTGDLAELHVISAPCECTLYAIQNEVKKTDDLYIKDEAYSLIHLLANDHSVDSFVGGTVIQGFLNTTDYHRWHAPVNGTIMKIVDVPGTYFAQAPYTLDSTIQSHDASGEEQPPPYLRSLRYFANTAARQLIFIQADYAPIGLMCFISIGMTEISTCKATVYEGQKVKRGDELGMFCFGGSSCAMVFRPEAHVQVDGDFTVPGTPLPINKPIAASIVQGN